jgi:hypothetical protein
MWLKCHVAKCQRLSGQPNLRSVNIDATRVLDEQSRARRARRQLDALESDNFHDDPHANLHWKKVRFFGEGDFIIFRFFFLI